jgi:YYY domain-containing protein
MSQAIGWWLILLIVGLVTLPLCLAAFRRLPDRGYTLSKPFALVFIGFTFWFLNSLHVLPNHRGGIIAAILLLATISALFIWRDRADLQSWARREWRYVLGVEAAFLFVFMIAVWLRSFVGTIEFTEQPMDLMFVNAAAQADFYPPEDPWLSGETVAYYYFGYVIVAMLATLTGIATEIAYNLGLAMTAALTLLAAFGIVYNLVRFGERDDAGGDDAERTPFNWRPVLFGAAGALFLVVLGNLTWVLKFASAYGIGSSGLYDWFDVQGIAADEPRNGWYPSDFFGFFDGSRVYPLSGNDSYVITEWPMFSFVLGDLHPHVMALPFVLLAIGLAMTLFRSDEPIDITFLLRRPALWLAAAVMLGALGFLNTWDIATLSFVLVGAVFISNFGRTKRLSLDLFVQTATFVIPVVLLAALLYLPFYASFSSQADGLLPVVSNGSVTVPGTRPVSALLVWGPLFALVVPFVCVRLAAASSRITRELVMIAAAVPVLLVAGWVLLFGYHKLRDHEDLATAGNLIEQIGDRGIGWITVFALGAVLAAALLSLWLEMTAEDDAEDRHSVIFALGLVCTAFLLIFGTEFYYVGDLFGSRMNTVFKLYYQAWVLLAIAGSVALYVLTLGWRFTFQRAENVRYAWATIVVLALLGGALYPLGGTFNRTEDFENDGQLDGLHAFAPGDLEAIRWLGPLARGQDIVIVEAVGGDYWVEGPVSRISAATGAPAVLGWLGHENQWRGEGSTAQQGRFEDVERLYREADEAEIETIVQKYGITYIYVGPFERTKYGPEALNRFQSFPIAFQSSDGSAVVYEAQGAAVEASTTP